MDKKARQRLALWMIRHDLRAFARERRKTHRTTLDSNFYWGMCVGRVHMARCCGLISKTSSDRFEARMERLLTANIARQPRKLKVAA